MGRGEVIEDDRPRRIAYALANTQIKRIPRNSEIEARICQFMCAESADMCTAVSVMLEETTGMFRAASNDLTLVECHILAYTLHASANRLPV